MRATEASRNRNRYLRRSTCNTGNALPLTVNKSPTNPWFGKCLKTSCPTTPDACAGCRLQGIRPCRRACPGIGDTVVQRDIEEHQRDVVVDVEGTSSRGSERRPGSRSPWGPSRHRNRAPGRRSGTTRPGPCTRWRRCDPCGDRGTRRNSASPPLRSPAGQFKYRLSTHSPGPYPSLYGPCNIE